MARLKYPFDLTPNAPVTCMIVSGHKHGKLVTLYNSRDFHREAVRESPTWLSPYGPPIDPVFSCENYRRTDIIVGDHIRHLLVPEEWHSLRNHLLVGKIMDALFKGAQDAYTTRRSGSF